ncbi:hypothetical protein V1VFAS_072 [Rhizobium phage V1VFA-S]|nr:hypothetical protein V1VFAS_072 [Rhizobium phage V1VFA-S]
MFEPNVVGKLLRVTGRDVHARPTYSEPVDCPCGIVNLDISSDKTVVRADSSASRGSADEKSAQRGKILIASYVTVNIGDRFEFDGMAFEIKSKHVRRSVMGAVDHFECDMELLPA